MDAGSLNNRKRPSTWKLAPEIAPLTQGLVVNGFGMFPTGLALFLEIGEEQGGAWLGALETVIQVTPAVPPEKGAENLAPYVAALAFTWTGLERMKLPETALASFSRPFQEGMFQEDRLRRLGDRRGDVWSATIAAGGPVWSANTPLRPPVAHTIGAYDVSYDSNEKHFPTPISVHAVLMVYTADDEAAAELAERVDEALAPHGVRIVYRQELRLDAETGIGREHFGFADGMSQPEPYDEAGAVTLNDIPVTQPQKVQGVPLGEFLIGYLNGHHEKAPGPVVPGLPGETQGASPGSAGLVPHSEAQGFYDFGLNGTYMVIRELEQDVAGFWASMDENAAAIRKRDPVNSSHITSDWLAERVVGRNRDGHLLCPTGYLKPNAYGMANSDYLFLEDDRQGIGCPLGSHVRRAFPRDGLAPSPDQGETLLSAANNHRILRRGRKFGQKIADERSRDGVKRGLLFICLNTDIARQFEFIQQTWLLNPDFAVLFEEVDPLIGPHGRMTIQEKPLRRTIEVKTFIQLVGGEYFFVPSLPALKYLAML
jgi:deferrochelatase/peroxidase EfeB